MADTDRHVLLDRDLHTPALAVVTLNRPEVGNAIDVEVAQRLLEIARGLDADPSVRAVLLRGEGRMFCAGGDVTSFVGRADLSRHLRSITDPLHVAVSTLRRMDSPVVAAVNGAAAGAGLALACGSDLVVASTSATFVMAYSGIGLSPDAGASWFLPRLVGVRRATMLALTNRLLTAQEAESWGIVSDVVADEELMPASVDLARRLADGPTAAFGRAKRLLLNSFDQTLDAHLEDEARTLAASAETDDAAEGIQAFMGGKPPTFTGR